jgi:hypothetical protein
VRWEIEYAIENDIPIIGVNLNGSKTKDDLCPPILQNKLAVFIPFGQKILNYALNHWPASHESHRNANEISTYKYPDSLYNGL